ncbi:MAG: hypothetical protein LCH36_03405 [Actinobacteria bacterium]|mgnify:CR=1 FL=1|jgi:hypothetical protein|nr:hypothetical protein [Actinomycetota bacterium]
MSDSHYTGPLNFAVFALPEAADLSSATAELRRLAIEHHAEILDVEILVRAADGTATRGWLPDELAAIETDLLQPDDLEAIVADLEAGEQALVVVYEDRTLASLAGRVVAAAGRELWAGGIDAADLDTDNAEPNE